MKTINKFLFLFLIIAASCNDVLDEEPETFFSEDQIFSTEEGVESAVNGIYQSFADPGYHGSSYHGLIMPLSGKFWSSQGASEDGTRLDCSPTNVWLTRLWPQMYQTINVANFTIQNLENTEIVLSNKETALGQAYFLRAATYFDLVRLFGEVPLKTRPTDAETLHTPKSSKEEVYDLIFSDFEKARAMLPEQGAQKLGRPSKLAVNAYLGKVYMQLAGEDNGNEALWQNAFEELSPILGEYQLLPTYAEVFALNRENSSESIFELQYGANGATRNSDVIRNYTPKNSFFSPENVDVFGRIRPNKETYDDHAAQYPEDPRIAATHVFNEYLERPMDPNDPDEAQSFRRVYPAQAGGNFGYTFLRKYFEPDFNGSTTNRNFIKIRYADVLLMLAEVENELNGPGDAYQYVNQVLTRARNLGSTEAAQPADWSGMSQDEFRTRILKERQYELLGEGHSWFDTRRRGYEYFLEEVVERHNTNPTFDDGKDFIYPVSIKNMLLPIPSNEISGNQAITPADQNPGY